MRVLIAGCGYLGCAVGARLAAEGHAVAGVRRPGSDPGPLVEAGITPMFCDLTRREEVAALPGDWEGVVHCAAPQELGEAAYRAVYLEGARLLAGRMASMGPHRVVFTGSTRVYGQNDGSRVTEDSPAEPGSAAGRVLRETEEVWRGFGGVVLRVAGIYGPGRHRLESLARGEARMRGEGRRHLNLVHLEDLVAAVILALRAGEPGRIYNVSDGAPPTEREFYAWLCGRMGLELPRPAAPGVETGGRRAESDKRVDPGRIRRELGWEPSVPSFREGYAPLVEAWTGGAAGRPG